MASYYIIEKEIHDLEVERERYAYGSYKYQELTEEIMWLRLRYES